MTDQSTTHLEGHLEKITFHNAENSYTIARFRVEKTKTVVTIIGYLPSPNMGEAMKINGTWETHPRFGQQFKVSSFEIVLPAGVEGIRKYLKSGFIKGVGPKTVARIIDHFGERTLEIIEEDSSRLTEVKGIGDETAARVGQAWTDHHAVRNLMQFLQENNVKSSYSARIFREYGAESLDILRNNPFRIANDIPGIGFIIADAIIQNSDIPYDDSDRAQACIMHLVRRYANDGNVFMFLEQLITECEETFQINREIIEDAVNLLKDSKDLKIEPDEDNQDQSRAYLNQLYEAETGTANRIKALLSLPIAGTGFNAERITNEVLKKLAIKLSPEQLEALERILDHRIAIITGGPGTGKTTLVRSISTIFEALGEQVCLAAPTGRAARRLSEVTGKSASTIHKLLGFNPMEGAFERDLDNPIEADVLIIDEVSMVDIQLMNDLLKAVHLESRLVFVGDVFQLPSVGPGNVLKDLIKSEKIATFELKEIFRQAQESPIIINAHKIREGKPPEIEQGAIPGDLTEFYFIEQSRPEIVVKQIVELCSWKIPEKFSLDPVNEIQVMTPMHRGLVGTLNLNQELQKGLNPSQVKISAMGSTFRLNDKVMHLKNNYRKEVFNGDIGKIFDIDEKDKTLAVEYDGRIVTYDFIELDELSLAYAISVHKSQGSEYPAVIIPVMTQHYALLQRNLLYTAITRGKKLVILIGTQKALSIALNNDKPRQRLSGLAKRL